MNPITMEWVELAEEDYIIAKLTLFRQIPML